MLLSRRMESFGVPHSSRCIIHTKGVIRNGDIIEVTSPVFASINFSSRAMNTSDRFNVRVRIPDGGSIENLLNGGTLEGVLKCDDNDVFNMYVEIPYQR